MEEGQPNKWTITLVQSLFEQAEKVDKKVNDVSQLEDAQLKRSKVSKTKPT
jgi:hypothetical protein